MALIEGVLNILREGNVFTGVCLSTGVGGYLWSHVLSRGCGYLWNQVPSMTGVGNHHHPSSEHGIPRDTVGKRAVHILLECFLVTMK